MPSSACTDNIHALFITYCMHEPQLQHAGCGEEVWEIRMDGEKSKREGESENR